MKRIKIAYFVDSYFPMMDGVTMVVDHYARLLGDRAEVAVFCPNEVGQGYNGTFPYRVVRCPGISVPRLDYRVPMPHIDPAFAKAISDFAPDIIHIHSPFAVGEVGARYAVRHGIPLVGTVHSQFDQDFLRATNSRLMSDILTKQVVTRVFNLCDERWAVNGSIRELAEQQYNIHGPVGICGNATELLPVADPGAAAAEINEKYNIPADCKVLLFVGRINALKNIFFLVRALAKLRDKNDNFRMLFVGNGQDEKRLAEEVETLGLSDRVILCGAVKDRTEIAKYYSRADLFTFPSLYDASSLVQIEAASQATPTIFLRGARTAGTVTENVNGFLGENDEAAFADKIAAILADENELARVSANAKRDLYITWRGVVDDVYGRYLALIERKNANNTAEAAEK